MKLISEISKEVTHGDDDWYSACILREELESVIAAKLEPVLDVLLIVENAMSMDKPMDALVILSENAGKIHNALAMLS